MTCPVDAEIRPMVDGDKALVIDSWRRSYTSSWDARSYAEPDQFQADYTPVILDILEHATVHVVCLKAERSAVIAWVAIDGDILHYVFVKRRWREIGLCKWLLGELGVLDRPMEYTHRSLICEAKQLHGYRVEPEVKIPKQWTFRKFKAWRKAS